MSSETEATVEAPESTGPDPEVVNFINGIQSKSPAFGADDEQVAVAQESTSEPKEEAPSKEALPKASEQKASDEGESEKGKPDIEKAREAYLERQRKRNAKREELDQQEQELNKRQEIVDAVLAALQANDQRQYQQQMANLQQLDAQQGNDVPEFEEDEAGNLDARLRRIEEEKQAQAEYERQVAYQRAQYEQQAAQVQQFVQQFAEDERDWMQHSPGYGDKSKALFEGTVQDMKIQGMNDAQAVQAAKQAIFSLAVNAYQQNKPPFEIIEAYGERYLATGQSAARGDEHKQVAKAQPKPTGKLSKEQKVMESGADGSLSQSRATAAQRIPMSVSEFREKNMSGKEVQQLVKSLNPGNMQGGNQWRKNFFDMVKEVEGT